MFITRNFVKFTLIAIVLFAKSYGEFRSDKPCYLQPLVNIANKSLYFGTNFKGKFFDAANFCRSHCMHLVSIENEAEQKGIVAYLEKSPYKGEFMWTSGNDFAKQGDFKWLATGQRISYTNWFPGEPNNQMSDGKSEDCMGLFLAYTWNDFYCTDEYYFICELRQ